MFAAALIGMYSMVSTMFLRVLRSEIGTVGGRIDSLHTEMNTRFEAADGRMDHVERSVVGLDRDVRMLIERLP